MAGVLYAALYDRFAAGMEKAGLREMRAELLSGISGRVLEIGAGTGLNVPHYPSACSHLVLTEPSAHMLKPLRARVRERGPGFPIEVIRSPAAHLPFEAGTFDAAVVTLTLCSVRRPVEALEEVRRVLRPSGRLHFIEHVAATPEGPSALQRIVQPFQRLLVDGCRLDHALERSLEAAGFHIEVSKVTSLPGAPPWSRPARMGYARVTG